MAESQRRQNPFYETDNYGEPDEPEYDEEPEIEAEPEPEPQPEPQPRSASENKASFISRPMNSIKEATGNAIESTRLMTSTRTGITILTLIVGIAILVIIALIIYWLIRNRVINRNTYLLEESKLPIVCTSLKQLSGDSIPNSGNGKRQTVSFWIYIYNPEYYPGTRKHVFHRGSKDDTETQSGPYVYLDEFSNKLHIIYAPKSADDMFKVGKYDYKDLTAPPSGKTPPATKYLSDNSKLILARELRGVTVDYIPVQRWVHVAFVVNEAVNGGSITVYLDGELVKTKTLQSKSIDIPLDGDQNLINYNNTATTDKKPNPIQPKLNITNVDLDHKGDIYIGGGTTDTVSVGFSGMVSKIRFSNYDLNAQDIYAEYLNGPIDSLLAKMGLAAYGIRSPIYRIQ